MQTSIVSNEAENDRIAVEMKELMSMFIQSEQRNANENGQPSPSVTKIVTLPAPVRFIRRSRSVCTSPKGPALVVCPQIAAGALNSSDIEGLHEPQGSDCPERPFLGPE